MNTIQRIVILTAVVLILLSILFPPFAAGKLPVGKNIHRGIGYHPIWNRPTIEYAYEVLHGQKYDAAAGEDLSSYFVMLNKVDFIIRIIFILLIASIMLIVFRKKKRVH
jgi:hypothetical protein